MAVGPNRAVASFALAVPASAASIASLIAAAGIAGVRNTYREVTIQVSIYNTSNAANTANVWTGDSTLGATVNSVAQRGVELQSAMSKTYRSSVGMSVFLDQIYVQQDPNKTGTPIICVDCFAQ